MLHIVEGKIVSLAHKTTTNGTPLLSIRHCAHDPIPCSPASFLEQAMDKGIASKHLAVAKCLLQTEPPSSYRRLYRRGFVLTLTAAICGLTISLCAQTANPSAAAMIICTGRAAEVSKLPEASKLDYPDCDYTVIFNIAEVVENPRRSSLPHTVQLLVPGFRQKKGDGLPRLQKNKRYRITMLPDAQVSDARRSITRIDDLTRFDLEEFYVFSSMEAASEASHQAVKQPAADGSHPVSTQWTWPTVPEHLKQLQQAAIDTEKRENLKRLEYFHGRVDELNRRFAEAVEARKRLFSAYHGPYGVEYCGSPVVPPAGSQRLWWANIENHFFGLPQDWQLIRWNYHRIMPQNIEALKAFRDFLERHGVQLIIELVPDLHDIAARVMVPGFEDVPDYESVIAARTLLDAGIEAIYTSDRFLQGAFCREQLFCYPANTHPHDGAQEILTTIMSERLKRYGDALPRSLKSGDFSVRRETTCYGKRYQWPANVNIGGHQVGEIQQCEYIYYRGERLKNNPDSPILVIGNSFIQTPQDQRSYCDRLAMHTGINPHELQSQLPVLPALIQKAPERYLKGKKVCIFPVGTRHLFTVAQIADSRRLEETKKLNVNSSAPRFALKYPTGLENPDSSICMQAVATTTPGVLIRNHKVGAWEPMWQMQIPDDCRTKTLSVLITLSALPGAKCRLRLCSEEREIANDTDEVQMYTIVFEIASGNGRENLCIRSDGSNTVLLLYEIRLFK